ncbi:MAG: AMP-binding protein [Gemmatimonadota bacterium]
MSASQFLAARDLLVRYRDDYDRAVREFRWPELDRFNWALDYFDEYATNNAAPALRIIRADGGDTSRSFAELRDRSNQVANLLRAMGAERGDRLLLMLPNSVPLWEVILGAMKLGVVVVPATPQLTPSDLADRFERGGVRHVVTDATGAAKFEGMTARFTKLLVGKPSAGWRSYAEADSAPTGFRVDGVTLASDPLLLYFTSGTTAKPKLVLHTHESFPVGHLTTMYWLGVKEGDRHLNISSPGWAKHAYSSFFGPWNAGATIVVYDSPRFDAAALLTLIGRAEIATLCAPPTVWRMVISEDLSRYKVSLREALSAGEPCNPEVIDQVRQAWGITIRDGYGQTETTLVVGNTPGQPVKPGSMGRPMPGYNIDLVDADGRAGDSGEICVTLRGKRPCGLMVGYLDDPAKMAAAQDRGFYSTGDVAVRDEDGYITYVGRADDVFKCSDYRISPFELESVLIEHPAVAEAGVVESPDPVRLTVPKAFVALRAGFTPSRELALSILQFTRARLAPYKRIRRLEFAELPKTISGKIRRVELRAREREAVAAKISGGASYAEADFPELESVRP